MTNPFAAVLRDMKVILFGSSGGVLFLIWLLLICAGISPLLLYEETPAAPGHPPATWPNKTALMRSKTFTLLMFLHPQCPCSRASLHELENLMDRLKDESVTCIAVFEQPPRINDDWSHSDLWKQANAIPRLSTYLDKSETEGRRFGVLNSGQALLYGRSGQLLFDGGITVARGHQGASPGAQKLYQAISFAMSGHNHTAVFGCGLFNSR